MMNSCVSGVRKKLVAAGLSASAPVLIGGHSLGGALVQDYAASRAGEYAGVVLMGAGLLRKYVNGTATQFPLPTLTMSGTLDGLYRVTRQSESYYHYVQHPPPGQAPIDFPVVVFEGMSHMQFASGPLPLAVRLNDLAPEVTYDSAHAMVATVLAAFLEVRRQGPRAAAAAQTVADAVQASGAVLAPIIAALEQEAFKHFRPPCNSDYPMPKCPYYAHYPDKPKGTTPQYNCTCGTPWTRTVAQQSVAGNLTNVSYIVADAVHDVSDEHPHHLPHIWRDCTDGSGPCVINVTTVTGPIYSALDGLDTGFYPIAATELNTKLKSRQAMYLAANLPVCI